MSAQARAQSDGLAHTTRPSTSPHTQCARTSLTASHSSLCAVVYAYVSGWRSTVCGNFWAWDVCGGRRLQPSRAGRCEGTCPTPLQVAGLWRTGCSHGRAAQTLSVTCDGPRHVNRRHDPAHRVKYFAIHSSSYDYQYYGAYTADVPRTFGMRRAASYSKTAGVSW